MKLKKCPQHGYTTETTCTQCKQPTKDAHYKYKKIKNAPKRTQ